MRRLLLDLDPYGGTHPFRMVPLFLKRTAHDVIWPRLNGVFRLDSLGSFPASWRQANVTPFPKGPPSSSVANCRQIFITSVLSKVFESLVSVRFRRCMERSSVLPTTQFAFQKGLGTCDALLCVSHTLQSALENGQEARIVQIDFSAAFDRVNHQGILNKLCTVGIGGSVLSILTQFIANIVNIIYTDSLLWMVIGVNWLTLYQEYRQCFGPVIVPSVHIGTLLLSGK